MNFLKDKKTKLNRKNKIKDQISHLTKLYELANAI